MHNLQIPISASVQLGLLLLFPIEKLRAASILISDDFTSSTVITDPTNFNRARTRTSIDIGDVAQWTRGASGAWQIAGGSLNNTSSSDSVTGESGIAMILNISSLTGIHRTAELSFEYSLGDADESLFLHTWGIVYNGVDGPLEHENDVFKKKLKKWSKRLNVSF